MSARPRLLPWSDPNGKPCYLVTDHQGYVSQVADEMENVQLRTGNELLSIGREMLNNNKVSNRELRFLGNRLCEALRDALRVAESRGERLPEPEE
ncbi:hypothetical protein [Streptomyces sp. 11-1-2]|uniref:hypothetical protein n=1 Tax=unclassified Streptomyces TaxID=2593676 RepID=UPI000B8D7927|nr:hypothetical protein [Streptomyces sp. 11-1-2]ASQ96648.1 hypothetical protein CGL27_29615 [Streptomyces sp. 11-1-2]